MSATEQLPYFKLFACCLPVRGATHSVLCDVQRGALIPISNTLHDVLAACERRPAEEVLAAWTPQEAELLRQNLAGLVARELGSWCDDPGEFPDIDLQWDWPATITNAIVELSPTTAAYFPDLVSQLGALRCEALELRGYRPFPMSVLRELLRQTQDSRLSSLELLLCHSQETTEPALRALCEAHPRVSRVVVHSAPEERSVRLGRDPLFFHTEAVRSSDHCGFVHPSYFAVNLATFSEAQSCNTCLNRKLAVDGRGEVRNCPAMPASYGNVGRVRLQDVVARADFRAAWSIRKDQIEVCRDCEFRYVCTDCRALLRDPGNPLSKPLHCGYDPYAARWNDPPAPPA